MLEITFQHSWQILLPWTNVFQLKIIAGNCLACTLSGKVCILARKLSQFSVFEAIQWTDFLFRRVNLLTKYKYILHHCTLFSVKTVSKSRVMFFVKCNLWPKKCIIRLYQSDALSLFCIVATLEGIFPSQQSCVGCVLCIIETQVHKTYIATSEA